MSLRYGTPPAPPPVARILHAHTHASIHTSCVLHHPKSVWSRTCWVSPSALQLSSATGGGTGSKVSWSGASRRSPCVKVHPLGTVALDLDRPSTKNSQIIKISQKKRRIKKPAQWAQNFPGGGVGGGGWREGAPEGLLVIQPRSMSSSRIVQFFTQGSPVSQLQCVLTRTRAISHMISKAKQKQTQTISKIWGHRYLNIWG